MAEQPLQPLKVTCSLLLDQNFSILYVQEGKEKGNTKRQEKDGRGKKKTSRLVEEHYCKLQFSCQVSLLVSPSVFK